MVQINFARKEVNCKIVYYGPGLCGKTTNIEAIYEKIPTDAKGKLTSIATEGDRTLFFDFLPIDLGEVAGMKTKFQLYTVPGQVYYNATRRLVLQGADGVVMVYDSSPDRMEDNIDALKNLEENLKDNGLDVSNIPFVIQYNKRDLPNATNKQEMSKKLNLYNAPEFEAIATKREGVMQTLKALAKLVLDKLNEDYPKKEAVAPVVSKVEAYYTSSAGNPQRLGSGHKLKDYPATTKAHREDVISGVKPQQDILNKDKATSTMIPDKPILNLDVSTRHTSVNDMGSIAPPRKKSHHRKSSQTNILQLIMLGILFLILIAAVIAIIVVMKRE